jgi:hypothetical protein
MGRPSKYKPSLGDEICARLSQGESLVKICKDDHMPAPKTVYAWLREHEDFRNNYVRARDEQAETYADEITFIADTATDYNLARLQVDARKWVASKLKPKKYGDKIDMTSGGDKIIPTFQVATEEAKKELEKLYERPDSPNS